MYKPRYGDLEHDISLMLIGGSNIGKTEEEVFYDIQGSYEVRELKVDNKRLEKIYETCQRERKEWLAKACKGEKETEKYKKCFAMEQDLRKVQLTRKDKQLEWLAECVIIMNWTPGTPIEDIMEYLHSDSPKDHPHFAKDIETILKVAKEAEK